MALRLDAKAPKVLLVCKGNICRSPAAEAILQSLSRNNFTVRSRGTRAWHEGKRANEMMRYVAIERGYNIETHIAHQLKAEDVWWATHILAFDRETLQEIAHLAPQAVDNGLRLFSSDGSDVVDPYGQNESVFQDCFDQIEADAKRYLLTLLPSNNLS